MNRFKKILALLASLALILTLAGCGEKKTEADPNKPYAGTTLTVGLAMPVQSIACP